MFRVFFQYEFVHVQLEALMPERAVGDVAEIVGQLRNHENERSVWGTTKQSDSCEVTMNNEIVRQL